MDAGMDLLAALRLQLEWGADEALADRPVDRLGEPVRAASVAAPAARLAPSPALSLPAAPPVARAEAAAAAAATLDELRRALAGFDGCALATTATSLVFADGNPAAGLMLVGDVPGAEEDRAGKPFVGPAGQFLDRMLASIGLDRTSCLMTNVIPWRPPGNRAPSDGEVRICLPFLLRQIALVRPRRLVLLGALPAKLLTGSSAGIRRLRGRWVESAIPGLPDPVTTLCLFHPGHVLQTPGAKRDAWADLRLLRRSLDGAA